MADIQAVILAESYPQRFNPISSEIPRVILFYYFKILFPFTHEPLIEKTLNWLINNNVHEIYILYQSLQTEIESYF